jgi:hypothetical protein
MAKIKIPISNQNPYQLQDREGDTSQASCDRSGIEMDKCIDLI